MNGLISWFGAILLRHPDYEIHPLAFVIGLLAVCAVTLFGIAAFVADYTGALIGRGEAIAGAVVFVLVIAAILTAVYELEHRHRTGTRPHA